MKPGGNGHPLSPPLSPLSAVGTRHVPRLSSACGGSRGARRQRGGCKRALKGEQSEAAEAALENRHTTRTRFKTFASAPLSSLIALPPLSPLLRAEEYVAHAAPVNCLAIGRHTGRFMATGGDDRKVMLWELGKANAVTVRLASPSFLFGKRLFFSTTACSRLACLFSRLLCTRSYPCSPFFCFRLRLQRRRSSSPAAGTLAARTRTHPFPRASRATRLRWRPSSSTATTRSLSLAPPRARSSCGTLSAQNVRPQPLPCLRVSKSGRCRAPTVVPLLLTRALFPRCPRQW